MTMHGRDTDGEVRQKMMVSGAESLTDAEIVSLVLGSGTDSLTALELAQRMLDDLDGSLTELAAAGVARLRLSGGCGTKRATAVAAAAELARRINEVGVMNVRTITSSEDVVNIFSALGTLPHEEFWVLYLSSGGKVIDRAKVSQGGVSGTVVDYKLIVKRAVELLSTSIILVHNHPSGVARPSEDDVTVTDRVRQAAALFDIKVIDHIIISSGGHYSFAAQGMMQK
jgi:DNA repair protein RadC